MGDDWSGDGAGSTGATTTTTVFTAPRPVHTTATATTTPQIHIDAASQIPPWGTFLIFVTVCLVLVCISRRVCHTRWSDSGAPERPLADPGSVLASMAFDGSRLYKPGKKTKTGISEELEMTLLEDNDLDEDELVFGRRPKPKTK